MKMIQRILLVVAVSTVSAIAQATPVLINFDTDLNGNPVSNGTLINSVYGGLGVTFNDTARVVLGGGGVTSQPNFATGGPDYSTTLELIFDSFASSVGSSNATGSSFVLTAFDANGATLGSVFSSTFPGTILLSGIGDIKRATFSTTDQYGIDDLTFDTTSVPEPGSVVLLGIGLLGFAASRRKSTLNKNA